MLIVFLGAAVSTCSAEGDIFGNVKADFERRRAIIQDEAIKIKNSHPVVDEMTSFYLFIIPKKRTTFD